MKYFISFIILGMTIFGHAQNHEIYTGRNAVSFFDTFGFRANESKIKGEQKYKNIQLVGYRYHLPHGLNIGFDYSSFHTSLAPKGNFWVLDSILLYRNFSMLSLNVQKSFSISKFSFSPQISLKYRKDGYRLFFVQTIQTSAGWGEPVLDIYFYKHYGFSTGLEVKHPIFRGLHGLLAASYTKFSAKEDQHMLLISYAIGYNFGFRRLKNKIMLKKVN
jgi:hypothetical protein